MSCVPDKASGEPRTFAEAQEASENLRRQVKRARQALSDYHAAHPVVGTDGAIEPEETARERAVHAADQPDLHRKA